MKTLAYIFNNFESPIISIDEACRRKKQLADKWENWIYYDIIKLRQMTATCRINKSSSFTYLKATNFLRHNRGSKGLAHELVQQYLCKLDNNWSFKIFGKEIKIQIKSVEDEYHIFLPDSQKDYFIDCMIHLNKNCSYYDKFNGKIGIEVTDTHKTSFSKAKAFKKLSLNVLELKMIPDWHIDNKSTYEKEDIIKLRGRIIGFLNKHPYLNSINVTSKI